MIISYLIGKLYYSRGDGEENKVRENIAEFEIFTLFISSQ